eukprot:Em0006g1480a
MKALIDQIALSVKQPTENYNQETCVLEREYSYIKEHVAPITDDELKNPHISSLHRAEPRMEEGEKHRVPWGQEACLNLIPSLTPNLIPSLTSNLIPSLTPTSSPASPPTSSPASPPTSSPASPPTSSPASPPTSPPIPINIPTELNLEKKFHSAN